tara:strand:+ start:97 stop:678 length:582 start_codon:yes stop_codon:yes gene_type:complete
MITEYHFPTIIYIKDIPNAEKLNQYLEPRIIQWSQSNKGEKKTNAGGWHSTTDMNKKEEYDPLTKELFTMQDEIYQKENLSLKPVLGNMWANVNYPGCYNRPHIHPNSLFSGVYFIKTPQKSGNLMVYDPRPGVQMAMPKHKEGKLPPELWREVHYEPVAGRCIMFPSWLWHEVKPNESNQTRISVSFNFLQR